MWQGAPRTRDGDDMKRWVIIVARDPDTYLSNRDERPLLSAIAVLLPFIAVAGALLVVTILVIRLLWSLRYP